MKLRNDKAVIFGGGSGIGAAIAKRLIDEGAFVTVVGRNADKLKKVKADINSERLFCLTGDIGKVGTHREMLEKASEIMGGLNAVINTAAVEPNTPRGYDPFDVTEEEWDRTTGINLKGAFFLLRNSIQYMLDNDIKGNILMMASNAAFMPIFGQYGSSKRCVFEWIRSFGKQFGHKGIVINGIAPGATFTPMIAEYAKSIDQPYPRHALERFIRPEEIAELACYLLSEAGEIICGTTVIADAGDYGHVLKQDENGNYIYG